MAFNLDKFDLKILRLLQDNARTSVKEISDKVYLSANAVSTRIARMEASGCITQYAATLNKSIANKNLECFTGVCLAQNNSESLIYFTSSIETIPEVYNYYHVNGMFDFLLHIVAKDMNDYHHCLVHSLSNINCVYKVKTFFVLSEMTGGRKIDLSDLAGRL